MKEWDFNKNKVDPKKIRPHSEKKVWWICPKNHEYKTGIPNRVRNGTKCPYCTNQKVGYGNSLFDKYPEVAKEWHPLKNGSVKAKDVFPRTNRIFWWKCIKGHEWKVSTIARTKLNSSCKKCKWEEKYKDAINGYKNGIKGWELHKKFGISLFTAEKIHKVFISNEYI